MLSLFTAHYRRKEKGVILLHTEYLNNTDPYFFLANTFLSLVLKGFIFMGYDVITQFMCMLGNNHTRVLSISVSSNIF
jgi:hypothetical protein